ncbi:UNVERIFIED_CONTAM: GDSL esterase/lipase LIP-4 [Sesamum radiatum]|uniref:GDSL esterase/lipase LIP-4 n=1 Tax=Sesamum radiatum TaxID=300843 RepID=A0AAW2L3B7_SESRA
MHTAENGSSVLRLLAFLALINAVLPHYSSRKTPVIFNFGDSNSDTGGFVAGLGLDFAYPYGRSFFQRPTGRASDGRLVIDFLCEYLNTHYLSPYLDSLEPDFTNGANFAIVGAASLPKSIHSFNLGKTNFLEKDDFKNALYTLDIGQNDLSGSFWYLPYAQVIERIPSFISEIKDAMWGIYRVGGRNFWVHNTGPLGCLPRELAIRSNRNDSDYDEYGCMKSLNEGAKAFNAKLEALCEELRSQMGNATIVYVDVYSIKYDLIANSSHYGFKNPLMACCGYGGAPYNYNDNRTCLDSEHTVCEEGTQHISWDGVHYSEAANAILASKILSTHYSSPPLQFDFFCNGVASSFDTRKNKIFRYR